MYPNLRHVRAFVAVAEAGSFVGAAEVVHLGQPALSQGIANLETLVGVRLLERSSRSLRLTPAGEEFLIDARRTLELADKLMRTGEDWARARRGRIDLLCLPSVAHRLLPALMQAFREAHPVVEIGLHDDRDAVLRQQLERDEGDLAILSQSGDAPVSQMLPFLRDRLRAVLPTGHALEKSRGVTASQLAGEQLILLRRGAVFRSFADAVLSSEVLAVPPIEVSQVSTLLGMVEAGLGVALLPALNCPSAALVSLTSRPILRPEVHRTIGFALPPGREPMPAVRAFVRIVLASLADRPDSLPDGCELIVPGEARIRKFLSVPRRAHPSGHR
jgi:LysR family transcriptional regulator, carnitine catabolism transcriptional activator